MTTKEPQRTEFPPRVWIQKETIAELPKRCDLGDWRQIEVSLYPHTMTAKLSEQYLSVQEHAAAIAEKDKQINEGYEWSTKRIAELERKLKVATDALDFYANRGGPSDTDTRKGCWILLKRFWYAEAISNDCEQVPIGETKTLYWLAGKRARKALDAVRGGE